MPVEQVRKDHRFASSSGVGWAVPLRTNLPPSPHKSSAGMPALHVCHQSNSIKKRMQAHEGAWGWRTFAHAFDCFVPRCSLCARSRVSRFADRECWGRVDLFGVDDINAETIGLVLCKLEALTAAEAASPLSGDALLRAALSRTVVVAQALGMTSVAAPMCLALVLHILSCAMDGCLCTLNNTTRSADI